MTKPKKTKTSKGRRYRRPRQPDHVTAGNDRTKNRLLALEARVTFIEQFLEVAFDKVEEGAKDD